jgi:hypothetical protein
VKIGSYLRVGFNPTLNIILYAARPEDIFGSKEEYATASTSAILRR